MINSPCSSLLYVQNSGTHRNSQQNWLPPTTSIKRGPWTVHTNHSLNLSLTVAQYHSPPHGRATCRRDIARGNPLIVTPKARFSFSSVYGHFPPVLCRIGTGCWTQHRNWETSLGPLPHNLCYSMWSTITSTIVV